MSESTSQLKIGAALDGSFEQTTTTVKRKIGELGTAATDTGKSLAGMGNGTAASAQKVEQATKSMIQSIQRTTAATEAGDKSTRAYQESLARMRGIDVAALKPYLDQLDAAKSKAANAAIANESFAASFAGIRNAALIASAAIGSFAVAFKKINDGVDALNDLKDATGASIENISALENVARRTGGSFDTVSTALVKLNQGLNSAKEGSGTEMAIKAIGLSVADLKKLDPAEAFRQTAVALSGFSDDANKARLIQELFGKSLKEVAPLLKDLAESGKLVATVTTQQAEEAEILNKQLAVLGKTAQDAARSLVGNMVPAINEVIAAMKRGGIGAGLDELGNQLFDWEGNANRKGIKNLESDLKSLREQQSLITIDIFGKKGAIQQEIDTKIAMLAAAKASYFKLTDGGVGGGRGSVNPALVDARESVGDLAGTKAVKESTKAIKENTDARRIQDERIKLSRALAIADGKAVEDANDAYKKMMDDLSKANDKYIDGLNKSADSIAENVLKLNDEDVALRISAEQKISLAQAIEGITIKRLEEKRVMELIGNNDAAAQAIAREIEQRKLLANAIDSKDAREAVVKSAADAAAEWKKTSDSINSTLTDALMRGFESGKDFAKNLRDTVVNMFKTLVLRPIISAVINPVAGALTGALGLSGAAQAAGTGSSVLSSVGTIAGLASTFGAGLKAGFAGLMGEAGLMGTLSAGTTALGAGNIAGGLGTLGGPLALATAAILGLSAIIKATSGETRNGAKYGVGSDGKAIKLEGPSGGEIAATQAQAMFNVAKSSIEGMLTGFGSKAVLTGFTAGLESSENGKGFAYSTGQINGKSFGDVNTYMNSRGDKTQEQALKDYQLELTQSILEGLQVTEDIPASIAKLISDGLNGSEVKALSMEATSAILANVETLTKQVNTFNAAMTQLPFESLRDLSFDTAAGLIAAAGGFDKFDASLTSYYANFYSAEEQRAQSITNTEAAFKALGLTMPTLDEGARSAYRAMVDLAAGQDLSVEANAKAYTGLLSLNGAMNSLAPAIDSVAQSAAEAAATMTSAWANVMQSRGVAANDVTRFTAQAAIDAAFTQFKKTDKFGIASAAQFETITQADFASYSGPDQQLIATILTGFSDIRKANAPAADQGGSSYTQDTYTAPDTSIADAIAQITKGLTDAGVSLGVELLKAQGKTVEAAAAQRAIETAGYNAAQIALYDYNQGLRDQITALGEASALQARIATERTGLQDQYDTLTMTSAELLTKQRNALDESNRALFDSINAIKAETVAKDAATKAAAAAFATLKSAVGSLESARTGVASGYNAIDGKAQATSNAVDAAELAITNGYLTALDRVAELTKQAAVEMRGFADNLRDFIKQMSMSDLGGSSKASQYAAMQADFATTAAQARAGDKTAYGQLTGKAQSLLAAGKEQSVTATDYARLAGSVGGTLEELATLADGKAGPFAEAIDPLIEAQKDLAKWSEAASQSGASTSRTVADYLAEWRTATTANDAAQKELKEAQKITQGIDLRLVTVLEQLALAVGTYDNAKTAVVAAGGSSEINTIQDLYQVNLGRAADTEGLAFWTKAFMQDGVVDASERQQFAISAMPEYLAKMGRSFAAGTNYVPHDMTAQIHKGEAIIPTAYNPFNPSAKGSGDTARLEALIDGLTQEVIGLRAEAQATASHTNKTARLLDRAMPDGDALATRTAA